ncbi:hypothetical protein TRVL_05975 [Trypanosoma vivax]|nr:hypothetical protein TRVL_05975 [Trypanosoma vivax]
MWGDWQAGQKSQNATERQGCAQRSLFQDWSLHQLPRKHRWSGGPSVGHKTPFSRRLLSPEDTVPTGGSSFLTHNESAYRISSEPSAEEYPLMREMNAKTVGNVSNQLLASSIARESEEHSASSLTSDDASVTFGECGLSEFITSRPVEIVDGVNRISVYAPSADYKTLASKSPRHKPLQQVYAALKTVGPQVSPPGPKPRLLYSPSYSDVAPLLALESVKVSGGHARRPVNDPTDMFLSQPPRVTSVSVQTEPIATSVERCVEHVVGQARVTAPSLSCDVTSLSHSEDVAHKGTNSASERNLSVVECENAGAGDTLTAQESVEGTDCLGNGQAVGAKKPSSSHSAVDLKEALKEMEASLLHSEQTVDRRCPDSEVKAPRLQTSEPTDCALHDKESVNSAPNVIQTAGSKENEDVSPLLHLQLPSGRVASSTKRAASLPISIQLRKNSTEEPTESRRASRAPASVRAVTSFDSSGKAPTNSHSLKGMQQTISPDAGLNKPIELRAASWYLPTTRVLQHNEFKSLLCSCVKSSHVSTAPDSNVYAPSQNNTRNEPLAETTPTANTLLSSCAPAGVHSKGSVRLASGANEPTGGTNVSGSNDAVTAGTAMNTVECEQPGIDAAQAAAGSQTRNMEPFESEQRSSGAAPEAPSQRQQKQQVGCLSGKCFWIFLMSFRKGSGRELSEENAQDRAVDGEREQQQQVQSENQPEGGEATSHNPNG